MDDFPDYQQMRVWTQDGTEMKDLLRDEKRDQQQLWFATMSKPEDG